MKDMHAQYRTSVLGHFGLRIVAGAILWQHGAQKLFGTFGGMDGAGHAAPRDFSLLGIAGPLEFLGGILIILGLFTRPVAFILAGEMAVIYFLMHFPHGVWPLGWPRGRARRLDRHSGSRHAAVARYYRAGHILGRVATEE